MPDRTKEKIKELVEKRVMRATEKRVTQKLLLIAKMLGKPIVAQSAFNDRYFDPQYREEEMIYDDDPIPVYDPDEWSVSDRGFHFDGLKCGLNLVVTALTYDGKVGELKATYNGYLVFAEVEGELKAYAPFPAWEDAVDMFYEAAVQIEKKKAVEERSRRQEEGRQRMQTFWQKFRMLWGY